MSADSFAPPITPPLQEDGRSLFSTQLFRRISAGGLAGFVVVAGHAPAALAEPAVQVQEASPQQVVDLALPVGPPITSPNSSAKLGELILDHSPRVDDPDLKGVKYGSIETLIKPGMNQAPAQQRLSAPNTSRSETVMAINPAQLSSDFIGPSLAALKPPKSIKEMTPLARAISGWMQPKPAIAPEAPKNIVANPSERRPASELDPSEEGIRMLARLEGWSAELYNDAARHATIGYGHLVHYGPVNGSESEEFRAGISEDRGKELLRQDLASAEQAVDEAVKVPITQAQEDVLNSFTFNVGNGALRSSTLVERLNAGDYDAVDEELMRWNMAEGRVIEGLTNRRTEEAARWNGSVSDIAGTPTVAEPPISLESILASVELAPQIPPVSNIGNAINGLKPPPRISSVTTELLHLPQRSDTARLGSSESAPKPYFQKPFNGPAIVTSEFGPREVPTEGASDCHRGVDFAMDTGDPVLAPRDGTVVANATLPGHGNMLGIMHDGVVTWYSHLHERSKLALGTKVKTGQLVGKAGSSGTSTGPHLHFAVQVGVDPLRDVSLEDNVNGHYVDPTGFLDGSIRDNNQFNTLRTAIAC